MDTVFLEECQDLQHLAERKFNFIGWVGIIAEDAWVECISSVFKTYSIFKQLLHWQGGYHTGRDQQTSSCASLNRKFRQSQKDSDIWEYAHWL